MSDFLPRREAELLNWIGNFDRKISLSAESFGLSPEQAAEHHVLYAAYASLFQSANDPSKRTPSIITAKDTARESLKEMTRQLATIVRAQPQVSDEQRVELGLRPRKLGRTPIGRPDSAPGVSVLNVQGSRVRIRLYNPQSPTRIGKARGISGAMVFVHAGDTPPADPKQWRRHLSVSRTRLEINLGSSAQPGQKVWIAAQWRNPREMTGPMSAWASTHVQYGGIEFTSGMKMAA